MRNPRNPAPYYRMLDVYIRIGNDSQIDKIAALLNDLDPKFVNIDTMNQLAEYYTDRRNLNGSEQVFRKIAPLLDQYSQDVRPLQKNMQNLYNISPARISNILAESYYEYARYKMLSSDFRTAGTMLTNSLIFDGSNEDPYNLLGEAYLRSSEPDKLEKAKELFDTALRINPSSHKAHINLGHLYYMWEQDLGEGSRDRALYHYKLASNIMPQNTKNPLMSYNSGWLEYQNKNPNDAIDIWSDIYKNNPENPALSYALGSALYQTQKPQLAQVMLQKSADSLERMRESIPVPNISNRRHREIYTQLAKTYNNIGAINANYAASNPRQKEYFESQALLNFYKAQDLSDQLNSIYNTAEYNIGVLTRPNMKGRSAVYDNDIPKQTTLENPSSGFNQSLLDSI